MRCDDFTRMHAWHAAFRVLLRVYPASFATVERSYENSGSRFQTSTSSYEDTGNPVSNPKASD